MRGEREHEHEQRPLFSPSRQSGGRVGGHRSKRERTPRNRRNRRNLTYDGTQSRSSGYGSVSVQPDGASDGARERESASTPTAGLLILFRWATTADKILMAAGSVLAVVHGVSYPVLALVFGQMTNAFLNVTEPAAAGELVQAADNLTALSATMAEEPPGYLSALTTFMSKFSFFYLALGLVVLIASSAQVYCWELACERQVYRLRRLFFAQVVRQDSAWFDLKGGGGGDVATKISDDLERVREGIGSKLSMVIQFVATFVSGLAVGLVASWRLTLAVLAVGPVMVMASAVLAKVVATASKEEQLRYSSAGAVASQAIVGIRTVAAFGGQDREVFRYSRALQEGLGLALRKYRNLALSVAAVYFLTYATYGLAFWYGAELIYNSLATPGSVFTVFFSVLAGAFSIGNALPFIQAVSTAAGAAAGVLDVLERVPPMDPYDEGGLQPSAGCQGRICFSGVSFVYAARPTVKVLRDFNLTIEPGSTVALVGSSGAGKSTVARLLLRLHDVDHGAVLLDGADLRSLNLSWLRSQIGLVSQDPVLFATSILENIRLGREGVSREEVEEAARTANAHEFITALPEGYDTLVGEGGAQLSGGQRQRVAIARALVRDPAILLLDEATSALDAENEAEVQAALDSASRGRTTIVIAHRLSTIRHADVIYAMRDGVVEESGSHADLMARGGLYSQLVTAQVTERAGDAGDAAKSDSDNSDEQGDGGGDEAGAGVAAADAAKIEKLQVMISGEAARGDAGDGHEGEIGKVDPSKVRLCRLFRIGAPELPLLLVGLLCCALTGSIIPVFAFFYGEVFQTFTLSGEELRSSAIFWTYMFLVLASVSAVSWWTQIMALQVASERLVFRLRLLVFRNVLHQAVGWFDKDSCSAGKLTGRLARDAPAVKSAAGWRIGQVVSALVTIIEAALIGFLFGWKLALVLSVAVPFIVAAYYKQNLVLRRHERRDAELMERAVRVASESVANIQTVQALGKERHFHALYSLHLLEPFREAKRHARVYGVVYALTQSIVYSMYAVAFRLGAYLIETGDMTAIDVYRVFFALALCAPQIGITSSYLRDFNTSRLAVGLMLQLVDRKPDIDCSPATGIRPELRGKLSLRDVHFRYPSRPEAMVLRGFSLEVETGKTVALVGASGCGKSTVLNLIERFYEPTAGAVFVDDVDIRTVNVSHLRLHMGLVTQDATLFDCSVRDNIAYGLRCADPSLSSEDHMPEIIQAAKTANIHDFIVRLPQGYDTLVGKGGAQLSGGQRQRVAIARALVRDPAILLLDEATSALDTESEKVVQEALERARRGRTCIVVAHRLSTVQNADLIVVMHRGRVVEAGSHAELSALGGRYHRLVRKQRL